MDGAVEFAKRKEFVTWLSAIQPRAEIALGYNGIANTVKAEVVATSKPEWTTTLVEAPVSLADAKSLWDILREDGLCLFHCSRAEGISQIILVSSRKCVWDSLKSCYLSLSKTSFTELTHDEAESIVSDEITWGRIMSEVQMFGISCRVFYNYSNLR
jgi:hypothetical protein